MNTKNPRDYGLPGVGDPIGPPEVSTAPVPGGKCPNCGCLTMFNVKVRVKNARLVGGEGTAIYVGCAACPYASPAVAVAGR